MYQSFMNYALTINYVQQTTDNEEAKCQQEVIVSFPLQEINHGIQNGAGTPAVRKRHRPNIKSFH